MKINKKGFTLIEILVVVLIIGVLAAVAIPGYRKSVEKAKATHAVSILSDAVKAEQDFLLASNKYTRFWDDLVISQPDMVAGAVYCLGGANTENQDGCGNDSYYKVKLTVAKDQDQSVVVATRMRDNPYGDYKLFKYMSGDPHIYCKASTTLPSDICKILGFRTGILPNTRNIDRWEDINCTEVHGGLSNPSNYRCDRIIYDDGSFEENAYYGNGNVYDLFSFDSEGKQTGDTWYFEDGTIQGFTAFEDGVTDWYAVNQTNFNPPEVAYVDYVNGKVAKTIWTYQNGTGYIDGEDMAIRTYDENGKWSERIAYYANGAVTNYRKYDTSRGSWGYFAEYNPDGSIKKFTCYTSMCGGSGNCVGAACASSQYASYIPAANSLPDSSNYISQEDKEKLCNFYPGNDMTLCQ